MPYTPIERPGNLSCEDDRLVDVIDEFLKDVRTMLRLPLELDGKESNAAITRGCAFACAMTLLNLTDSVGKKFYLPRHKRTDTEKKSNLAGMPKSKMVLIDYYPWGDEPDNDAYQRLSEACAADILIDGLRNPLTHKFGFNQVGKMILAKSGEPPHEHLGLSDDRLSKIETDEGWPFDDKPTLVKEGSDKTYKLTLKCFYWGVRIMIKRVLKDYANHGRKTSQAPQSETPEHRTGTSIAPYGPSREST